MPVPTLVSRCPRSSVRAVALALSILIVLFLCPPAASFARGPQPALAIPLEPLGFQPLSQRNLLGGSSMITLDYVDSTHLLLTFNARRLIRRIPGDPPTDEDRNVDALLLELPSGRVVARAEWLLHDHGQYLWNLGHGQFLFRVRDDFSILAPLANLEGGTAFQGRPFLHSTRRVEVVNVSADATFLTIESSLPQPSVSNDQFQSNAARSAEPSDIQINFYHLDFAEKGGFVLAKELGALQANHIVELPTSPGGILQVLDQGRQRWAFDFKTYTGKLKELALFDSTCRPIPVFISLSEFIAFGCRGGSVRQQLAGFNLRGDATWEMALSGPFIAPHLVFAPSAGRFALGRVITVSLAFPLDTVDPGFFTGQSVDVYQNDSGKHLFHIDCFPIVRAGQNFTLSPDGMNLAVIREDTVEIFPLPPLSPQDKTAIKLSQDSAPPATNTIFDLPAASGGFASAPEAGSSLDVSAGQAGPVSAQPAVRPESTDSAPSSATTQQNGSESAASKSQTGDSPPPDPPVRRKPPTLYNPPAPSPDAPPEEGSHH
jgi:hypothetical protein